MVSSRRGSGLIARVDQTREKWVNVSWMPHTSLSHSSQVCLLVRSVHASVDDILCRDRKEDWKLRVGLFGIEGMELTPVMAHTPAAALCPRQLEKIGEGAAEMTSKGSVPYDGPMVGAATHDCRWDYVIQLPLRWRELPRDAYLLFTVLGESDSVIYEGTMPFFSEFGKLSTGLHNVQLQAEPLKGGNRGLVSKADMADHSKDEMWTASYVLDHIVKREEKGIYQGGYPEFNEVQTVPWLDEMVKERCKEVLASPPCRDVVPILDKETTSRASLIVELPTFDIPILHEETFYQPVQNGASGAVTPLDLSLYHKEQAERKSGRTEQQELNSLQFVPFLDFEHQNDNPVEDKYRALAHDLIRGLVDPALKPDREQRERLAAIIDSPSHHPTRNEKDLLWRFRFSLVDNRRALTKFLIAVDWTVESEVVQAAELLEQWRKRSPIEVTDALKLLGKHVAFQTNLVRDYAIDTLASAPDSELRLYLLQLVQALKYEISESPDSKTGSARQSGSGSGSVSALATFLINRASKNMELAVCLYW